MRSRTRLRFQTGTDCRIVKAFCLIVQKRLLNFPQSAPRVRQKHAGSDSNTQPADLESAALPIELPASARPVPFVLVGGREIGRSIENNHFRLILCKVCLRSRGEYF